MQTSTAALTALTAGPRMGALPWMGDQWVQGTNFMSTKY